MRRGHFNDPSSHASAFHPAMVRAQAHAFALSVTLGPRRNSTVADSSLLN